MVVMLYLSQSILTLCLLMSLSVAKRYLSVPAVFLQYNWVFHQLYFPTCAFEGNSQLLCRKAHAA